MREKENLPRYITHEQHHEIVELIQGIPEVIFLFSGGIAPKKDGGYRPTTVSDGDLHDKDAFGYLGGVYRMLATVELANIFPNAKIVTTGIDPTTGISHAKVYAEALEKNGVDEDRILFEEKSTSTRGQLREMVEMAVDRNWGGPFAAITNGYHMVRMIDTFVRLSSLIGNENPDFDKKLYEFTANGAEVLFVAAEEILDIVDPKYSKYFDGLARGKPPEGNINPETLKFYKKIKEAMDLRWQKEYAGVIALESGTYQKRDLTAKTTDDPVV